MVIGGLGRVGGAAPAVHPVLAVMQGKDRVGVPDVDSEQHGPSAPAYLDFAGPYGPARSVGQSKQKGAVILEILEDTLSHGLPGPDLNLLP